MSLVKDVALTGLGEEEDARGMAESGRAVGVEGGAETGGEIGGGAVGWKVEVRGGGGRREERVLVLGEVFVKEGGLSGQAAEGGGDGVEFDLLDLQGGIVLVHHVIGAEEAQSEVLSVLGD